MVEIVMSVVGEVAAKVTGCLLDPITRQFGYLFNFRRNITDLNQQIDSLDSARERLQIPVDAANNQGNEIFHDVQKWLKDAEEIIKHRDDFNEDEKRASKSCFYFKSRYRLSKRAKKQAEEIAAKINEASHFGDRVYYRPPPTSVLPSINSASFKDYEAFESRDSTFNQIMEALRNEDVRVIGVWGMGGVGKTTLVKQVAKQAEEDKLFHKVVMALHISQTPNISEIQGQIARILGLIFPKDEDRAVRLRKCLKKQEKVLVILDDLWEKLELGEIGIPYGDDHKGCKLLLTSRERWVLDTDMRTEKVFHLQHLNSEESWILFKKTAGVCVESPDLQPVATNVVKECDGLPVAIVTVANALKNAKAPVWENALEELRRSAPENIRGVSNNVYSCLELSYNHLEGEEVKSLFLLCGLLGVGDISTDRLLHYAMGLKLFKESYSWEKAANKLITLVEQLKVSSLLLDDHEDEGKDLYGSLFFDDAYVIRMHDVVRDVSRSIASKDPQGFVVREAIGLQEAMELREWQRTDECRNCRRMSLMCRNMDELPQGFVCPQLEFFLLNSSNDNYDDAYLKIPNDFFQATEQLRVLDMWKVSFAPSLSSFSFLSNMQTLCLDNCQLPDIAVIGELKRLQVLSLAMSDIERLPEEMKQLSDLRVLDLRYCFDLRVIPRNVISSLSRLEYLSMEGSSDIEWELERFNTGERSNAYLSEVKHLSGLRTLGVEVSDSNSLPKDDALFDNLNYLTRYSIQVGRGYFDFNYEDKAAASRKLILKGVGSLRMLNKLCRRSQVVYLDSLEDTKHVVNELDKDGFVELKYLAVVRCDTIQYILDSTSPEWVPPGNTLEMLEELNVYFLNNLEGICHGPIPMRSFLNLRSLRLHRCKSLRYVFSFPTNERESDFPQLQSLSLRSVPKLLGFYSSGSGGSQESITFFNHKAAFPALEVLVISYLNKVTALWHNQLPIESFSKLKSLDVSDCNELLNLLPLSVAKAFVQLEYLSIEYCGKLETIVANEDEDEEEATPLFLFPKLASLRLNELPQIKRFSSRRLISRWPLLKTLQVYSCYIVSSERLFQEIRPEDELHTEIQQSFFLIEKAPFPGLEFLEIGNLENVKALWHNQLLANSFSKLKELSIRSCNKLVNIFPSNILKELKSLHILEIQYCDAVEEIFEMKGIDGKNIDDATATQSRSSLSDKDLQGFLCFQNLQSLKIEDCRQLKYVFPVFVAKNLTQLQDLRIKNCGVETIVANEDEDENETRPSFFFPKLTSLYLNSLHQLKKNCFVKFTSKCPDLKKLDVRNCDKVEMLFQEIGLEGNLDDKVQQPLFLVEKAAFPSLEKLVIYGSSNMKALWHNQLQADSFPKLKELSVRSCNKLLNIFPSNIHQGLQSLQILDISFCDALEEIFYSKGIDEKQKDDIAATEPFPNLERLTLSGTMEIRLDQFSRMSSPFPKLRVLSISEHDGISVVISSSNVQVFHNIERLEVKKCNSVEEIIQAEGHPRLTEIRLEDLPKLTHLSGLDPYFQNLQTLEVVGCESLKIFLTPSTAKRLVRLKELIIEGCNNVKEIVENKGDEGTNDEIEFTSLKSLILKYLGNLESFCSARYTFRFPSLEETTVERCPKMECFCNGVLKTPRLKPQRMRFDLYLRRESDLNTTIREIFMERHSESNTFDEIEEYL